MQNHCDCFNYTLLCDGISVEKETVKRMRDRGHVFVDNLQALIIATVSVLFSVEKKYQFSLS